MIKKAIIGGAIVLGLSYLLLGTSVFSYIQSAYQSAVRAVDQNVPIDAKIEHAKNLIEQLESELKQDVHTWAEAKAELKTLQPKVDDLQDKIAQHKDMLTREQAYLEGETATFVSKRDGTFYTEQEVLRSRNKRVLLLEGLQERLTILQSLQDARAKKVTNIQARIEGKKEAKETARIRLANLEAKLELVRAHQTELDENVDGSTVGQLNELVSSLEGKVTTEEEKTELLRADSSQTIPLEVESESFDEKVAKLLADDDVIAASPAEATKR